MADVAAGGMYDPSCPWCEDAFSSVLQANLTLFQIVSGDGWSLIARPIISHNPWTALLFLGLILTMSFGLLNVLVAVMVENAQQGRQQETHMLALEREEQKIRAQHVLLKMCEKLDTDNSGQVSLEEMKDAVEEIPEFKDLLVVMDLGSEDIDHLFHVLDEDKSGSVSPSEFSSQLWRMKEQETRTMLMFVKYYVKEIWEKVCLSVEEHFKSNKETFANQLNDAVNEIKGVVTDKDTLEETMGRVATLQRQLPVLSVAPAVSGQYSRSEVQQKEPAKCFHDAFSAQHASLLEPPDQVQPRPSLKVLKL